MRAILRSLAILIAGLFLVSAAHADNFSWSFIATDGSGVTASGSLTATPIAPGEDLITSLTGTYDGSTITSLLPPGTCCGNPANDNDLFFPGTPYLDLFGLAFGVGGLDVNIFSISNGDYVICTQNNSCVGTDFTASGVFNVNAPEPSALAMLFAGLLALGLFAGVKRYSGQSLATEP